jgi:hypothetical protein
MDDIAELADERTAGATKSSPSAAAAAHGIRTPRVSMRLDLTTD